MENQASMKESVCLPFLFGLHELQSIIFEFTAPGGCGGIPRHLEGCILWIGMHQRCSPNQGWRCLPSFNRSISSAILVTVPVSAISTSCTIPQIRQNILIDTRSQRLSRIFRIFTPE
jgi:hypothetical protein